jgi:hypothetical protein
MVFPKKTASDQTRLAAQCTTCRKAIGVTLMQDLMLKKYGNNPKEILVIRTGLLKDDQEIAIGAGGFICQECGKKYCVECSGPMNFRCCGTKMFIGTHYLL